MTTDDPFASCPEEWLIPRTSDYPCCAFLSKGDLLLVLFIREMEGKPHTQGFAMVADPQNRVYLITKCEVSGFISKTILLEVCRDDREKIQMKIPLSNIHPAHRKDLTVFLAQAKECFRTFSGDSTYPEGLFQPTIFLTSGWI